MHIILEVDKGYQVVGCGDSEMEAWEDSHHVINPEIELNRFAVYLRDPAYPYILVLDNGSSNRVAKSYPDWKSLALENHLKKTSSLGVFQAVDKRLICDRDIGSVTAVAV